MMNVPNILTMFRVVFAIAVFVFCAFGNWDLCLLFFILASLTDFADGWWARKFKQVTVFGRIMDPFADKFLVCGVFICLLGVPDIMSVHAGFPGWLMLQPWMVVVIVARELLVTSLRAFVEKSGGDFSAKWIGKWKMGFQCIAIVAVFALLASCSNNSPTHDFLDRMLPSDSWPAWLFALWIVSLWATVGITLYSGVIYCFNAAKAIRNQTPSND